MNSILRRISCLTLMSLPFGLLANESASVDTSSCVKMKNTQTPFILVLKRGENVGEAILQCVKDAAFTGATFQGIGALQDPVLSYYDLKTKKYQNKKYDGIYELVSLNGNVSQSQNERVIHMHVALGSEDYNIFGGHLKDATVGITGEILINPLKGNLVKKKDKLTGLILLSPNV